MSVTAILRFLIGDRESILNLAADPWSLAIGFIFVLSAGFARNYARKDLVREPWYLAIPFVASIVSSLGLFAWLYVFAWPNGSFVTHYLSFLCLYWLTAPLAWLYATPVERWMSRGDSVKTRLAMLGVVAAWRLALIVRSLYVLLQADDGALLFAAMIYVSGLAVFAICLTLRRQEQAEPVPEVIELMGGMPPPARAERRLLQNAGCFVVATALPCFALSAVGLWITYSGVGSWQFSELEFGDTTPPHWGVWLLAVGSILVWLPVLPTTQGRLAKARQVQQLSDAGEFSRALNMMTEAGPNAFPPGWEPPPNRLGKSDNGVWLLDAIDATRQSDSKHWLLVHYRRQLEDFVSDARWFWETDDLDQLVQLMDQLSSGKEMAAIAWKSFSMLSSYHDHVVELRTEIETVQGEMSPLGESLLDPTPEMTKHRVAAIAQLQQLAGVEPTTGNIE